MFTKNPIPIIYIFIAFLTSLPYVILHGTVLNGTSTSELLWLSVVHAFLIRPAFCSPLICNSCLLAFIFLNSEKAWTRGGAITFISKAPAASLSMPDIHH